MPSDAPSEVPSDAPTTSKESKGLQLILKSIHKYQGGPDKINIKLRELFGMATRLLAAASTADAALLLMLRMILVVA